MTNQARYEDYPLRIVCSSLILTALSYLVGTWILYSIGWMLGAGYLALCLVSIGITLMYRCRFCWYYGRQCYSGFGRLVGLLIKKGDSSKFGKSRNLVIAGVFSFGVLILPVVGGIALLIIDPSWQAALSLAGYFVIAVVAGFIVRQRLACAHCTQGEMGCPAYAGIRSAGPRTAGSGSELKEDSDVGP